MAKKSDPATKADIRSFRREMASLRRNVTTKKDLQGFATKQDLERFATKKDLTEAIDRSTAEMKLYFDFVAENLGHNFRGALSDKISLLNDKVYAHDEEIRRIKHFIKLH